MIYLCVFCWILYGIRLFQKRRKKGFFADERMEKRWKKIWAGKNVSPQVAMRLKLLYPAREEKELCYEYYDAKRILVLKVLFCAVHMITILSYSETLTKVLTEDHRLIRGDYGAEQKSVYLKVHSENTQEETEIEYEIESRQYSEKEIQNQILRFEEEGERLIRGENETLDYITKPLNLRKTYGGYPMQFAWESSDYELVDADGEVYNEQLTTSEAVTITVTISYGEEEYIRSWDITIVPKEYTVEESWKRKIVAAIKQADENQIHEETILLPDEIEGTKVYYTEQAENPTPLYFLCAIAIAMLVSYAKDKDLEKAVDERNHRLVLKYPEFVTKFQLLLGAGMTIRAIFIRLEQDHSLGEFLHQELHLFIRDTKNGMALANALDRFGKRCANPLYIKFSAILIQNLKKGTKDLQKVLENESREAFLLRKNHAKQLGEEVGTKLLGPMMLMLGIVMVLLMVPAFMSFQF